MWDEARIGAGASPIKTPEGWLVIYHGATYDNRYCLGAMLLDLNDPSVVLSRSIHPIMEPLEPYRENRFLRRSHFLKRTLFGERYHTPLLRCQRRDHLLCPNVSHRNRKQSQR